MQRTKLSLMGIVLLGVGTLIVAAGMLTHQALADQPAAQGKPMPPVAKAPEQPHPGPGAPAGTDQYGDPLPKGAVARMGTVRWHHHDVILSLALSPDGKVAASGGGNYEFSPAGIVRLWDLSSGREIREVAGSFAVFSPDGKSLATSEPYKKPTIHIWEVATGKELQCLARTHIGAMLFSPDGKTLAYGTDERTLSLWEIETGKTLRQFQGSLGAFSPDGTELATTGPFKDEIYLWDVATGKKLQTLPALGHLVHSLLFSPDGKMIVTGSRGSQGRWPVAWRDRDTGKELREVQGDFLTASPNGKLLAILDGRTIQLWDVAAGKELRSFQVPGGSCIGGGLSADGKLLLTGAWNTIHVWDTQTGKELHPVPGHETGVRFVGFAPDSKQLITTGDSTLRLWNTSSGEELHNICLDWAGPACAAIGGEGRIVAHRKGETSLGFWDVETGREIRQLVVDLTGGDQLALSPDANTVATVLDNFDWDQCIVLEDVATGKKRRRFGYVNAREHPYSRVEALTFSPDGKVLAEVRTGVINLWDTGTGKHLMRLGRTHFSPANYNGGPVLAFSPDGRIFAAGAGDNLAGLWEAASGKPIYQLRGHTGLVWAVAFSPDGRTLASAGQDATVRLWDVTSGRELVRFEGQRGGISALAFSSDGRVLASGSLDTTAVIWDVTAVTSGRQPPLVELAPGDLERLWEELQADDAARAYSAVRKLAAAPKQAVPFLRKQLPLTAQRLDRLIADLDDEQFDVREKASRELEALGRDGESKLRAALEARPSAEMRKRLAQLLEKLPASQSQELAEAEAKVSRLRQTGASAGTNRDLWLLLEKLPVPEGEGHAAETLRAVRGVQILEQVGTPEARAVLHELAERDPRARLTQEARASVERLAKRPAPRP